MDQIVAFATLFIGIITGPQEIELLADRQVARIELRLDDEVIATLDQPPWQTTWDFGLEPRPQRLSAVAFDADGNVVAETEQLINMPRPASEARLALERTGDGTAAAVQVSWRSVAAPRPGRAQFWLDETEIESLDPERVALPPVDEHGVHLFRAELTFAQDDVATAELPFGGGLLDRTESALTAVAFAPRKGKASPEELRAVLTAATQDGQPLSVMAVEEGFADLVVVRDVGARSILRARLQQEARSMGRATNSSLTGVSVPTRLKRLLPLDSDMRVRMVSPLLSTNNDGRFFVFDQTGQFDSADGGLLWLLSQAHWPEGLENEQRLTDAVAVAGMNAFRLNRRRAVLVVLGDGDGGESGRLSPAAARGYLDSLRVPLVVWSIAEGARHSAWGEVEDVTSSSRMRVAVRDLWRLLERQRIAWVEGRHLPGEVRLAGDGVEALGTAR